MYSIKSKIAPSIVPTRPSLTPEQTSIKPLVNFFGLLRVYPRNASLLFTYLHPLGIYFVSSLSLLSDFFWCQLLALKCTCKPPSSIPNTHIALFQVWCPLFVPILFYSGLGLLYQSQNKPRTDPYIKHRRKLIEVYFILGLVWLGLNYRANMYVLVV